MGVYETIAAQQGKDQNVPVYAVGELLKSIIDGDAVAEEIVGGDLDKKEMELSAFYEHMRKYAEKHKSGSVCCIPPALAEKLMREFYGLDGKTAGRTEKRGVVLDITDFM